MTQAEKKHNQSKINPLIWVAIGVFGLILFIFLGSDRGDLKSGSIESTETRPAISSDSPNSREGQIQREASVPPGVQARELIGSIREKGKPYPLEDVMTQAASFVSEGNLADAHLAFFFAAREGNVKAMMTLAEMSDPTLFQSENNLLDKADALQAYKWYKRAINSGFEPALARLDNLYRWAEAEARFGNAEASQLLLNFK